MDHGGDTIPAPSGGGGAAAAAAGGDVDKPMWLTSWKDQLAAAAATSACMELSDLNGDANYKLVVAAAARRLKVFSGTSAVSDSPLLDVPVGVVSFYTDASNSDLVRLPLLAVATGQYIFMYKSLRPYYKFVLPPVELSQQERDVWARLKAVPTGTHIDDAQHLAPALQQLEQLRDRGQALSARSTDLLAIESPAERLDFVERSRVHDLVQNTVVTCIAVVKCDREDMDASGCLVVGTEAGALLLLDKTGAQIAQRTQLPSVPVQLLTSGLVDGEYRVLALCRDGRVYITKNGELVPGVTLQSDTMITCFTRMDNNIICGVMSKQLLHFSLRGLRVAALAMPSPVVAMAPMMPDGGRQPRSIVVGLASNEVRVYTGKTLMNRMPVAHSILGLRVGRYGTEDNCLCISFKSGVVTVLMLPRTAKLDPRQSGAAALTGGPPKEQDQPLQIPKRTSVYVENLQRERDYAADMYRAFHRDVVKLRLATTRSFAKLLADVKTGDVTESFATTATASANVKAGGAEGPNGGGSGGGGVNIALRMTCTVAGLGPSFRLRVGLQNTGGEMVSGLYLVVLQGIYSIDHPRSAVPSLVPSVLYNFDLILEAPEGCNSSDSVRVLVCAPNSTSPIVSQRVEMPVPDGLVQAPQD